MIITELFSAAAAKCSSECQLLELKHKSFVTFKIQLPFWVICGNKVVTSYADPLHCWFGVFPPPRTLIFSPTSCVCDTDTTWGWGIKLAKNCALPLHSFRFLLFMKWLHVWEHVLIEHQKSHLRDYYLLFLLMCNVAILLRPIYFPTTVSLFGKEVSFCLIKAWLISTALGYVFLKYTGTLCKALERKCCSETQFYPSL